MVERFDGNKSAAADVLGISRTRLYRLLEPEEE
jgi:DNA-binding NtrC family response regulator